MAGGKGTKNPEQKNFRLWPGVMLLAGCMVLLFVGVHLVAYRVGLLPVPVFLQGLGWQQSGMETTDAVDAYDWVSSLERDSEVITEQYYKASSEPAVMLAQLVSPAEYHQRMRFSYDLSETKASRIGELYVQGEKWKILRRTNNQSEETGSVETILCDGENILREGIRGDGVRTITPVGDFVPQDELGIPTLAWLQALENPTLQYMEDAKYISVTWSMTEDITCTCYVSLDTGLVMEMTMRNQGKILFFMYTELFDIAPEVYSDADFFTIR